MNLSIVDRLAQKSLLTRICLASQQGRCRPANAASMRQIHGTRYGAGLGVTLMQFAFAGAAAFVTLLTALTFVVADLPSNGGTAALTVPAPTAIHQERILEEVKARQCRPQNIMCKKGYVYKCNRCVRRTKEPQAQSSVARPCNSSLTAAATNTLAKVAPIVVQQVEGPHAKAVFARARWWRGLVVSRRKVQPSAHSSLSC